jgi:hypothetical protein
MYTLMYPKISIPIYSRFLTFHGKTFYSNSMYIYNSSADELDKPYNPYNLEAKNGFSKGVAR